MRNSLRRGLVVSSAFSIVAASLAVFPDSADAQLFQRLFNRRDCNPCAPTNVYHPVVTQPVTHCGCGQSTAWGDPGYVNYGATQYGQTSGSYVYSDATYSYPSSTIMPGSVAYQSSNNVNVAEGQYFEAPANQQSGSIQQEGQNRQTGVYTTQDDQQRQWQQKNSTQTSGSSWQNDRASQEKSITALYAGKMYMANHCEIELSQLAQEKATHDDVKQLAKTIEQDHRKLNQQLRSIAPQDIVTEFAMQSIPEMNEEIEPVDNPAEAEVADLELNDETETSDRSTRDARSDQEQLADRSEENSDRVTVGRVNYDRDLNPLVSQVSAIEKQAAKNGLNAAKEMLNEYAGQDFDMAFVGIQIAKHQQMLATLKAMNGVGTSEFQNIVSDAKSTTERHLEKARELSKKLDDDRQQDSANQ